MAKNTPVELPELKIYRPKITDYKLKMLIYGPPGAGKTTFAATAELHDITAPALFVNIEGGMLSIAEANDIGIEEPPSVVDLEGFSHLDQIFWYLAKGDHPFKTVVIDSLSELQIVNLEHIVGKQLDKTSTSGAKREDEDDIWQEDYGKSTQELRRFVRKFRDLPMHVIFTAHDASSQDKDKNEIVHPALTPKLRTAVSGYMDIIGYMFTVTETIEDEEGETEEINRKLLCQPYKKWVAKDRSPGGRLGMVIDNPDVPTLVNKIMKKEEV